MPANSSIIEFSKDTYLETFDLAQRLYCSWSKNVSPSISFGSWRYNHVGDYAPRSLEGVNGVMQLREAANQALQLKLQEAIHGP